MLTYTLHKGKGKREKSIKIISLKVFMIQKAHIKG